jgi:hypothetical protein
MKSRSLSVGVIALVSSLMLAAGTASAHGTSEVPGETSTCVVKSLPSFVDQGEFDLEATVADIIEVGCDPYVYGTGKSVEITASQLYSRCGHRLRWFDPDPYQETEDQGSITVPLDADGNATVAVLAGPGCFPGVTGENLIGVHMLEKPFESFATSFGVLPPGPTPEGLKVEPSRQI